MKDLSLLHRFFFYGLHGFFDEIVFTSVHDFVLVKPEYALRGHSSLWSFPIYGIGSLLVEYTYRRIYPKTNIVLRGLIYVLIAFSWEFTTGLILKQFSACPWDYTHKDYDFMGLITIDYAPFWCFAGLYEEYLVEFLDSLKMHKKGVTEDGEIANGFKPKSS
eukprot:Seg16.7 transcript_id=Seg16.7/GoldUCD/mRNA.D3Y31 product="Transmembrane protein 229B" protein_id=Seg16.7/GoldUCD/D3Y31